MNVKTLSMIAGTVAIAAVAWALFHLVPSKPDATPPKASIAAKSGVRVVKAQRIRAGGVSNLYSYGAAHLVLIGRVEGIDRTGPVPINAPPDAWVCNAVVYNVRVEEYLKGKGPAVMKVWEEGGEAAGILDVVEDSVPLQVGDRYLLCVKDRRMVKVQSDRMGYVPCMIGQHTYIERYNDEYPIWESNWGKVRLTDGVAQPSIPPNILEARMQGQSDSIYQYVGAPAEQFIADLKASLGENPPDL